MFGFNSRAREGRDWIRIAWVFVEGGFNSRAREGRDARLPVGQVRRPRVSIHAPARGATFSLPSSRAN